MYHKVNTPCIGLCSTALGDGVCRGCKRFAHEVIDWNGYTAEQQQAVVDRLDDFLVRVVGNRIDIFDEKILREQMGLWQIHCDTDLSSSRWVYELLRAAAGQIREPEAFGFRLKADWRGHSLEEIKQWLDRDFYTLSCAHYERYMG